MAQMPQIQPMHVRSHFNSYHPITSRFQHDTWEERCWVQFWVFEIDSEMAGVHGPKYPSEIGWFNPKNDQYYYINHYIIHYETAISKCWWPFGTPVLRHYSGSRMSNCQPEITGKFELQKGIEMAGEETSCSMAQSAQR